MALEQEKNSVEEKNQDKTIIVVGDKRSGKSTFLKILKSDAIEKYVPTSGIQYSYVRKSNYSRKELIHAYEIGGGREAV